VQLDAPAQAAAFLADPDDALRNRREPLLLDEWQSVPAVLWAVRRAVDSDPRPGRFILTGSVRAELESEVWPGTGRLIRLQMHGLTEAEILSLPSQRRPAFLDRLAQADLKEFDHSGGTPACAPT
jgi:predicted AAA+ superfamily ATPase